MSIIIDSLGNKYNITIPANPSLDSSGEHYIICPICTPGRQPNHKNDKKLAINFKIQYNPWRCNHCGESGSLITDNKKSIIENIKIIEKDYSLNKIDKDFAEHIFTSRKISLTTLNYFKVMAIMHSLKQINIAKGEDKYKDEFRTMGCVFFPSYDGDDLVDVQFRDKNKNFASENGATKIFFNINDMKGAKRGIITEGRFDTISIYESGCEIPACSVPNGATVSPKEIEQFKKFGKINTQTQLKLKYLDIHYWVFEAMEEVIIGTDDDAAGIKLREELARRIGKHKCKYIKWSDWKIKDNKPCKDANDVLIHCGPEELKDAWKKAKSFPISGLIRIADTRDELKYERENGKEKGLSTGFYFLDSHFTVMMGHIILTGAFMNHGKTALSLQIALQMAILYGIKSGVYMPENMPAKRLVDKIVQMLLGKSTDPDKEGCATQKEIDQAIDFINEYIFIVHETGHQIYSHEQLRDKASELIARYGIKMFFKDPWNRVRETRKSGEALHDYLNRELSEEAFFAERNNIAWWINAHPKTPDVPKTTFLPRPSAHSFYGGEVWPSKAHEILILHRESTGAENKESFLYVDKTKDHEIIGLPCPNSPIRFEFHRKSQRFYDPNDNAFETEHILDRWKHGIQTNLVGF